MLLAAMVAKDEGALICDFAETYHIYNWRSLPARYAATLAAGLKPDSRIKLKLSGVSWSLQTMLLAAIADATSLLVWQGSQAAVDGKPPPKSFYEVILGKNKVKNSVAGFSSATEFLAWREKMMRMDKNA